VWGYVKNLARLLCGESTKVAQLNDTSLTLVGFAQSLQRVIQGQQIGHRLGKSNRAIDGNDFFTATPLLPAACACSAK